MKSKFHNASGKFLTRNLFYETAVATKDQVLYTLKEHDHEGYPSLYRLYLEMEDITEYEFANKYFYNYRHWKEISESNWFKVYINRWREELDLKMKARALQDIIKTAKDSKSKSQLSAAKYLLEKGWEPKESSAGRPKKEEILKEARKLAEEEEKILSDAKRLQDIHFTRVN